MWERFKKRVTNFIYEDVEEEEEYSNTEKSSQTGESKDLTRKKQVEDVKTRMTFQYPKNESESFRFPVIPDERDQGSRRVQRVRSRQRVGSPTETNQPAFERRRNRVQRPTNRRRHIHSRSIYEQKKLADELENVPAFERRKMREVRAHKKSTEINEEKETRFINLNQVEHERTSYSKPDELDAVFRKRDNRKRRDEPTFDSSEFEKKLASDNLNKVEGIHSEDNHSKNVIIENEVISELAEDKDYESIVPEKLIETKKPLEPKAMNDSVKTELKADLLENEELPHNDYKSNLTGQQSIFSTEENKANRRVVATDSQNEFSVPYHLLDDIVIEKPNDREWLRQQKQLLQQTLEHFNIDAKIVAITQGPTVTRIEIQPALGVKVSRIRNLADDIKLNLAARDIRIEAPIPGKHTVGIEIPNEFPQVVHLQEMLESKSFRETNSPLTVALGLTIEGEPYFTDINKMPHGLIAGATGSGKSVCINAMILSLLYKSHYEDVKLMMIDPKMVELTQYNGVPHLLTPVITDAKAATVALKWAVDEMERRYELFVDHQVRNIKRYNRKATEEQLPYIVIIIDELADLMLVSPQEVEDYISRIAQKARAAGIHLILATQRPSVDVITGLIKANIPSRIAFSVSSQVDSRTILDANGAEKLLGKGDMLFVENGMNKQLRLQGPFVSDDEIDRVVHYLRSVAEPDYLFEHEELFLQLEHEEEDELFEEVVDFVLEEERASTSLLQRRFRIGYNRAARLIDSMYDRGIISAQNGSRPRDVLITKAQWLERINNH